MGSLGLSRLAAPLLAVLGVCVLTVLPCVMHFGLGYRWIADEHGDSAS